MEEEGERERGEEGREQKKRGGRVGAGIQFGRGTFSPRTAMRPEAAVSHPEDFTELHISVS